MVAHHRAVEANLGHVEANPVALEGCSGMESHHSAVKAHPAATEARPGALMFTLKRLGLILEL